MAAVVPMRKRAPRVAAMGISALRGVIRHARSMNRLDLDALDPTAGIPTIPQDKRNRALSDAEIGQLLRWLESGAVSRTIVDILRLTLYTGARSGEVCSMRSADVDMDAKTWTHTQGKTGDVSLTPLSAPAVEILRNRLGEEYVFPVRGRPVAQKAHWSAHPACDEMQSVSRPPSGIATVSISCPSGSSKRNFSVPSDDVWRVMSSILGMEKCSASAARNVAGSTVMDAKSAAGRSQSSRTTCEAR